MTDYALTILLGMFVYLAYWKDEAILYLIAAIYTGFIAYFIWDYYAPLLGYDGLLWGAPLAFFSVYSLFKFTDQLFTGRLKI